LEDPPLESLVIALVLGGRGGDRDDQADRGEKGQENGGRDQRSHGPGKGEERSDDENKLVDRQE
jgi:hypothetical protein